MKTWLRRRATYALLGVLAVLAPATASSVPLDAITGVPTLAPLMERVTPAVVNIAVVSRSPVVDNPLLRDPLFRRFFNIPDEPQQRTQLSAGSGVIIDAERGYVLSNHHVVANGIEIFVTLKDRRRFKAQLVGSDEGTDLALLRIEPDNLTDLPFGDSDALKVGDFVVAIGNPFGLGQTATSGIVSALGRSGLKISGGYEDFIQTDASINPGNSGGALVNLHGELIGVNTAILSPAGGNVGIGFAVPSNMARSIVEQLTRFGEVRRGRLGVMVQDVTPEMEESLGLSRPEGALITQVEDGSPADRGGIRSGDVITAVDGKPVTDAAELRNRIGLVPVGQRVEVDLVRNGRPMSLTLAVSQGQARREPRR
jgi:Do/DeqQ family serine protease